MSFTIRKAVNKDFAEIYELICELVDSPVSGISFSALRKIYQANLHSEIKGQYRKLWDLSVSRLICDCLRLES